MTTTLENELAAILGPGGLVTDPNEIAPHTKDWRGRYNGVARCLVRPCSTAEVSATVKACINHGVPIVPQGGNTGVCGGAIPDASGRSVVVNLARMNRVRTVDPVANTLTTEAGATLVEVRQKATDAGRLFPLDLGSEGSCQIGGNIASNAGGTTVLRYGNMRELVLGLEAVLPDGRVFSGLRSLRKDNTGYDLRQLFIGSEGTLGIVTAAVLKLFPQPRSSATAFVALAECRAAITLLARLRETCGDRLTAIELMSKRQLDAVLLHVERTRKPLAMTAPWYVLVELTDTATDVDWPEHLATVLERARADSIVVDAAVAASESQAHDFWRLRHTVSEANVRTGRVVSHDTAVPIAAIAEFIARTETELVSALPEAALHYVGHVGDGNVHAVVVLPPDRYAAPLAFEDAARRANEVVHRLAASLGGCIGAEHGVGQSLRDQLPRFKDPIDLDLMRGLKRLLDPNNLMNPGKVVG
ncbi:MAG: FAD-binding oxidoreductase [Alphaproteobacteria bacterium]|nr:FAD-binding oxidoreductase [Alphaproteobacteria bacterium]